MPKEMVGDVELDEIIGRSEEQVWEPWKGCVVVAWKLPSGFVLSDMSAAIDVDNASMSVGVKNCRHALRQKLREYVAYERMLNGHAEKRPVTCGTAALSAPLKLVNDIETAKSRIESMGYDYIDVISGTSDSMEDAADSIAKMKDCRAVFFAYGWEHSNRCLMEHTFAVYAGKEIFEENFSGRFEVKK